MNVAAFMFRNNWDLQLKLVNDEDWLQELRSAVLSQMVEAKTEEKQQRRQSTRIDVEAIANKERVKDYCNSLIVDVFSDMIAKKIYDCRRRDCIGGCDDHSLRHYGPGGNFSQHKVHTYILGFSAIFVL